MLDLKWLRDRPEALDRALRRRGLAPMAAELAARDGAVRALQTELQQAQARRNALSKEIGRLHAQGAEAASVMAEVGALKEQIQTGEQRVRELADELEARAAEIPNVLGEDVPDGAD